MAYSDPLDHSKTYVPSPPREESELTVRYNYHDRVEVVNPRPDGGVDVDCFVREGQPINRYTEIRPVR